MTSTGTWTDKDKLVTLEQLGRIQDENSPNELNGGKAFSEGYRDVHEKRKKALIYAKLSDIGQALFDSQVVVVVAATETGKTIQIPQYCLHQLRALGIKKRIDVVQPSRMAASACGERLRVELDCNDKVDSVSEPWGEMPKLRNEATICVTTDKIYADTMAQEDMQNPGSNSAIIIIDEIQLHSLDVQLLLGILPSILKSRPDLKLILTSETFDAGRLVKHFSAFSPIQIDIPGAGRHHLEHVYLEPGDTRSQDTRILQGLKSFFLDPFILSGDCLVFLKNEEEAYDTLNLCSRTLKYDHEPIFKNVEFLTLTRDDPLGEFEIATTCRTADDGSGIKRKIIFATSIVASSITIPGIRLVMITGKNEVPRFDPYFRGTEMVTYQLSKGEIIQMCGRAGRTRSGTAMHLYHCKDSDKLA